MPQLLEVSLLSGVGVPECSDSGIYVIVVSKYVDYCHGLYFLTSSGKMKCLAGTSLEDKYGQSGYVSDKRSSDSNGYMICTPIAPTECNFP